MHAKIIKDSIMSNWAIITVFLITIITVRVFYLFSRRGQVHIYREIMGLFALFYSLILFSLLTNSETNIGGGYNIVPFTEISRYTFGSNLFKLNVLGNILAFIPFGYFVCFYIRPKKVWPVIAVSSIISTSVEFIQLFIGRTFDVDDIMLNVLGAILGYLLYIGLSAIKRHLPKILQKDGLYNVLCIIIIAIIAFYILKVVGV